MIRQIRVSEWIGFEKRTPTTTEVVELIRGDCLLLRIVVISPRCTLKVEEFGKRRPNCAVTSIAETHTQIYVVEGNL